jgi:hypothetical protein
MRTGCEWLPFYGGFAFSTSVFGVGVALLEILGLIRNCAVKTKGKLVIVDNKLMMIYLDIYEPPNVKNLMNEYIIK